MKKEITKEKIIETALMLMRDGSSPEAKNLRAVARALDCAHTNLYNYFPSYNDLLWDAYRALMEVFLSELDKKLQSAGTPEQRLTAYFGFFTEFYLDNKGWFRLVWQEQIGGVRPQRHVETLQKTNAGLNRRLSDNVCERTGKTPDSDKLKAVLHTIHCYIIGEVSNFILGRGIISDETELRAHVTREAVKLFRFYLQKVI